MDARRTLRAALWILAIPFSGCAAGSRTLVAHAETPPPSPWTETGMASYISADLSGRRTASGARFDPGLRVAAHRTLPFGTRIRVTNLANDRDVVVTVVDRGPFRRGRIVDLSPRAARALGFLRQGTARVRIEVLGPEAEAAAEER